MSDSIKHVQIHFNISYEDNANKVAGVKVQDIPVVGRSSFGMRRFFSGGQRLAKINIEIKADLQKKQGILDLSRREIKSQLGSCLIKNNAAMASPRKRYLANKIHKSIKQELNFKCLSVDVDIPVETTFSESLEFKFIVKAEGKAGVLDLSLKQLKNIVRNQAIKRGGHELTKRQVSVVAEKLRTAIKRQAQQQGARDLLARNGGPADVGGAPAVRTAQAAHDHRGNVPEAIPA